MSRLRKIKSRRRFSRARKKSFLSFFQNMNKAKFLKFFSLGFLLLVVGSFFLTLFLFAWFAKDLPRPDKVVRREGFASKIFDRNGDILYDVYSDEKRIPLVIDDVPDSLKYATISIEDKNFYQHQGFDLTGWIRAMFNIVARHRLQGGSTLTQQLVKNVLLTSERTLPRKIKEFILSIQIERKYSKDEILQMYLNEAPYGGTSWGVEAASELYFSKKTKNLSLLQSAFLAGLPQSPSIYSPFYGSEDAYKHRTTDVLRRMREEKHISKDQEKEALKELEELSFTSPSGDFKAPHFVMYVRQKLEEKYGAKTLEVGGLKVYTSLDLDIQEKAQEIVTEEIAKVEKKYDIGNGAAIVIDPNTGEILAMVGSKDYFDDDYDGKVNVTTSLRQPGSSIKPVTFAAAFKNGYTPATMIVDTETDFPGGIGQKAYRPKNYTLKEYGPTQLRYCLGNSLNICSVKTLAKIGLQSMMSTAYDMGFDSLEPTRANMSRFGLAVTLGGAEVRLIDIASSYSSFANSGYRVEPVAILKVEDINGKTLEEVKPKKGKRVLSKGVAYLINSILSDNSARFLTFGNNSLLNIGDQSVAVKTGTTDDKRDNWAIGWTTNFVVGVWVGNNDNSPMKSVASGISGASPIWRRISLHLLNKFPASAFPMPNNIIDMEVDQVSGYKSHDGFASRKEYFIKGTEPDENDPIHTKLKLCKGQEKLATDIQIAKGEYEQKEYIILKEDDPISNDGKNRWQEAIDAWISKQGDSKYHYPKDYCDESSDERFIRFNQPENEKKYNNEISVDIDAYAKSGVKKIELYVNSELKETIYNKPYAFKIVLPDGVYTLRAKMVDNDLKDDNAEVKIGVNKEWDWSPEPTPTPTVEVIPTVEPSNTPTPTPTSTPAP